MYMCPQLRLKSTGKNDCKSPPIPPVILRCVKRKELEERKCSNKTVLALFGSDKDVWFGQTV